jgi:hypothetical protein
MANSDAAFDGLAAEESARLGPDLVAAFGGTVVRQTDGRFTITPPVTSAGLAWFLAMPGVTNLLLMEAFKAGRRAVILRYADADALPSPALKAQLKALVEERERALATHAAFVRDAAAAGIVLAHHPDTIARERAAANRREREAHERADEQLNRQLRGV